MSTLNAYEKISNDILQIDNNASTNPSAPIDGQNQPNATVMMVTQPQQLYAPPPQVGPKSTELTCPHCRCRIKTRVTHRSTSKTHIACLLLSFTCCCCCLPYCMDSCRNANHTCPMCGAYIGTYES